jgi:ribosome biogenesis GTPase A
MFRRSILFLPVRAVVFPSRSFARKMPPKKVVEEPKMLLGKPKGHLKMGIVGVPNVGKSTLFNVLTKLSVPAEKC